MPKEPTPRLRRTGREVQREIVTGLERLVLTDDVILDNLIGMGGYAEVYDGTLLVPGETERRRVAIKRFRVIMAKEKEFAKVRVYAVVIPNWFQVNISYLRCT